jgi:hypothetical protein
VVLPAGTITTAGVARFALLVVRETENPAVGADETKVIVHAVFPGVLTVIVAQESPSRTAVGASTEITPELAVAGTEAPFGDAAATVEIWTGMAVVEGLDASVAVTIARGPSAMA